MEDFEEDFVEKVKLEKIIIRIPPKILSNIELSFNEKLILSLDYTYSTKKGYNMKTNVAVGLMFNLHPNIVGNCRKQLLEKGYIAKDDKEKRKYVLTDKIKNVETLLEDKRVVSLPYKIYSHLHIPTGAKLLWGEYNSMRKGKKHYFATRDYTSKRLNASKESITIWTKLLDQNNLLEIYAINSGYYTKEKVVKTRDLKDDIENSDVD